MPTRNPAETVEQDQEQDQKQEGESPKQGILNDGPRAHFLRQLFTIAALTTAAAIGVSCRKEQPPQRTAQPEQQNFRDLNHPAHPDGAINFFEDKSIPIPRFEIMRDKPYKFPKPSGITMDDKKFAFRAERVGGEIRVLGMMEFEAAIVKNPESKKELAIGFIKYIIAKIIQYFPEATETFKKLITNKYPTTEVTDEINKYLNPGGYHIEFRPEDEINFDIFSIKSVGHVKTTLDGNELEIPVVYLGTGHFEKEKPSMAGDKHDGKVYIFTRGLEEVARTFSKRLSPPLSELQYTGFSDQFKLEESSEQKIEDDVIRHEATHVLLEKKFETAKQHNSEVACSAELKIEHQVGDEIRKITTSDFSLETHPVLFHELCATGAMLANSELSLYEVVDHLTRKSISRYHLAVIILANAIVMYASNCPLRKEMLERMPFFNPDRIPYKDLFVLIEQDEKFGTDHARKVGEIMYRIGYNLFIQAEKNCISVATTSTCD